MTLRALILAVMASLAHHEPTPEQVTIADAIEVAVQTDAELAPVTSSHGEDAVLLAVYAWHESRFSEHPRPRSWDATAHVSCGTWQMRCAFVEQASLATQAAEWIHEARAGGLASLDSSPRRAAVRELQARALLVTAMATAPAVDGDAPAN